MKRHFYRSLGEQLLTFEELSTVTCQIERFLNSRPLSAISDQPQDLAALTPGHFLVGRALNSMPEPIIEVPASVTLSSRWRLVNHIKNHFWVRWSKEILSTLQRRPKWPNPQRSVQVNDLVILIDENMPSGQ